MELFKKKDGFKPLTDPFDDRLMIGIKNEDGMLVQSMSLSIWKKEIKEGIEDALKLISNVKNNPLFIQADNLLKKNIEILEEQNLVISENKKRIEKQNQLMSDNEVKLNDLNKKTSSQIIELEKKKKEIEKFSLDNFLNEKQKMYEVKFNESTERNKTKIYQILDEKVNKTISSINEQLLIMANKKLNKLFEEIGIEAEKTFEWVETKISDPIAFIDVIITNIKSDEKDLKKLDIFKKHLKEITSKEEFKQELGNAVSSYNSYMDLSKKKGDTYETNCLITLRELQMKIEGFNIKQKELEKAKEEKKKIKEVKTEKDKPIVKKESEETDEEETIEDSEEELDDSELVEKTTSPVDEDSEETMPEMFKMKI